MKNISFLKKTALAALSLTVVLGGLSAQELCKFTRVGTQDESAQDPMFPGAHRSRPVMADYNNDGLMDIFYGGEDLKDWKVSSHLLKNNGDGTFTTIGADESGLPISVWSDFQFFDYNNDGNLDLILTGGSADNLQIGSYVALYKNLGPTQNYKFEHVADPGFRMGKDEGSWMHSITIGDYNKDGLLDVAIIGLDENESTKGRFVELYKNKGNDTFSAEKVATTTDVKDTEGNLLPDFAPMSNGNVMFGDLDKDGWLDMVSTGYSDIKSGGDIRIYRNMKDGTFHDITPVDDIPGVHEGEARIADINSDGYLDIFLTGLSQDGRLGSIFMNNQAGGFDFVDQHTIGLSGVNNNTSVVADLNNDGYVDIVYSGWSDTEGHMTRICYQSITGTFLVDATKPLISHNEGGIAMGDYNNDKALDFFVMGWNQSGISGGYSCPARLYKNELNSEIPVNNAPVAPTNLSASITDGKLTVTWNAGSDDITPEDALAYNVYVKNAAGKVFMLIPADVITGKLKTLTDFQVLPTSLNYSMTLVAGNYTIGVQTVDQGLLSSSFVTTNIGGGSNIASLQKANIVVNTVAGGIRVTAEGDAPVMIMDMCGRIVNKGNTNETIPVTVKGVYLVTVDGNTFKVVK